MIRQRRLLSILFSLAFVAGALLLWACGDDETPPSQQVDIERDGQVDIPQDGQADMEQDGQADMEQDVSLDTEVDLEEAVGAQSTFGVVAGGGIATGDSFACRMTIGDWPATLAQGENYRVRLGVAAVVNR